MKTLLLLFCLLLTTGAFADWPKGPAQPTSGPGGRDYKHAKVRKLGPLGVGAKAFWLYEPDAPAPASAPVIVFLHGYIGVDAKMYGGWIEHLVRRGNVVIFPIYQTGLMGAETYTGNALAALQEAFRMLRQEPGHVRPDEAGNFALVGHSLGGPISANIAGMAKEAGLPRPKALMACHAGDVNVVKMMNPVLQSPAKIPDLMMLMVYGADDHFVGSTTSRAIFTQSTGVRPEHKNLITIHSDKTGLPVLQSNHLGPLSANQAYANGASLSLGMGDNTPVTPLRSLFSRRVGAEGAGDGGIPLPILGRTDALDYFGYWKWFDALTDYAFYGTHRQFALGDTPDQTFMGMWSDGRPVVPAEVELAK